MMEFLLSYNSLVFASKFIVSYSLFTSPNFCMELEIIGYKELASKESSEK